MWKKDPLVLQVKSSLLPPTAVERILEWVVECLPRRLIGVTLKPSSDVLVLNSQNGAFQATSHAPSFEMTLWSERKRGGWYYIEASLMRNNGSREANIRVVVSRVPAKSILIPIPTNLRGSVREVFYLPPNYSALCWSPTAAPGFFSQSALLVHKITALESVLRRIYRVYFDLWRYRNVSPVSRHGLHWGNVIGNLDVAYQCTAAMRVKRLAGNDYSEFIRRQEEISNVDILFLRRELRKLTWSPLITLIMSVELPIEPYFTEALDAINRQAYTNWELLVVGRISLSDQVRGAIKEMFNGGERVQWVGAEGNLNTVNTLNVALNQARGEFILRIDSRAKLHSHALFFILKELQGSSDVALIYTDDDSIDTSGCRFAPRFKPDWNPDLFLSYNYIGGMILYRRDRMVDVGGYREGFDGSEEYDLSLRYLKGVPATKIRHLPRGLCHWMAAGNQENIESTKGAAGFFSGCNHQGGLRALQSYFEGTDIIVEDGASEGLYRVKYPLPRKQPKVTIIVPTRDQVGLLKRCVDSVRCTTDYLNWELLIVDNQSADHATHVYLESIQLDSRIKVIIYDQVFNYSALNNYAVQFAKGEIVALVNNDVEAISSEWLSEMVSHAMRPEIGAVGAKLVYSNGMVQHAGVILGVGGVAGHGHKYLGESDPGYCNRAVVTQNFSAVTGACMVVRKSIYNEIGGLNEHDFAVAFNDVDFCLRLRDAGYRNLFTPYAKLYHHESMSRGRDDTPEKQSIFKREYDSMKRIWGVKLEKDPAYNSNLTLEFEDFSLRM